MSCRPPRTVISFFNGLDVEVRPRWTPELFIHLGGVLDMPWWATLEIPWYHVLVAPKHILKNVWPTMLLKPLSLDPAADILKIQPFAWSTWVPRRRGQVGIREFVRRRRFLWQGRGFCPFGAGVEKQGFQTALLFTGQSFQLVGWNMSYQIFASRVPYMSKNYESGWSGLFEVWECSPDLRIEGIS